MVSWEERITESSDPSIQIEHQLRYQLAAPLIEGAAVWCDLGCGTGVGAKRALKDYAGAKHVVLVDLEEAAVQEAKHGYPTGCVTAFSADLTDNSALQRIRETLLSQPAPRVITCFETMEHLANFVPLVELLISLAGQEQTTVLLSVPNDAFWSIENPHHLSFWGEGAFAELCSLLPKDHTIAHQVALNGSAVLFKDTEEDLQPSQCSTLTFSGIPTHFLVGFGANHEKRDGLQPLAGVVQTDLTTQRTWVRQRESNLALADSAVEELEKYRQYIHELEDRLEISRSGEQPPAQQPDR